MTHTHTPIQAVFLLGGKKKLHDDFQYLVDKAIIRHKVGASIHMHICACPVPPLICGSMDWKSHNHQPIATPHHTQAERKLAEAERKEAAIRNTPGRVLRSRSKKL